MFTRMKRGASMVEWIVVVVIVIAILGAAAAAIATAVANEETGITDYLNTIP